MQAGITYIHHSAFILTLERKTFLFDYPEEQHLPPGAAEAVRSRIAGTDLYVFVSHGHADHFNSDLGRVVAPASQACFIISDDVAEMFPEAVPAGALIVEPDGQYRLRGMSIETLMSNDLGVGFIIVTDGISVYYGGDLAEWIWPEMAPAAVRFTETYFQEVLDKIKQRRIHIAFSNLDKRLPNLAGGLKLLQQVKPAVFVPMHAFGDTAWYAELEYGCDPAVTRIFGYRKTGDAMIFELEP
jgi:L-ascorbate metabolism protein UlaG (beta-lactamase superfamily)